MMIQTRLQHASPRFGYTFRPDWYEARARLAYENYKDVPLDESAVKCLTLKQQIQVIDMVAKALTNVSDEALGRVRDGDAAGPEWVESLFLNRLKSKMIMSSSLVEDVRAGKFGPPGEYQGILNSSVYPENLHELSDELEKTQFYRPSVLVWRTILEKLTRAEATADEE